MVIVEVVLAVVESNINCQKYNQRITCNKYMCLSCGYVRFISHKKLKGYNYEYECVSNSCKKCEIKQDKIPRLYKKYKKNANIRGVLFELSIKQFEELVKSDCFYCGGTSDYKQKYFKDPDIINGIDRINSNSSYNVSNSVPCCTKCNKMKSNLDLVDFYKHIIKIYCHYNKIGE